MTGETALTDLHQALAYRPGRERIDLQVDIDEDLDIAHIAVDDGACRIDLPENRSGFACERVMEKLSRLLAHYPVPVTINGMRFPTAPFADEASVVVDMYDGDLTHPRRAADQLVSGNRDCAVILIDHVAYEINDGSDRSIYAGMVYEAPDWQDRQPHYCRIRRYTAFPSYRAEPANGATDWTGFALERRPGEWMHTCRPLPAARLAIEADWKTRQLPEARAAIQRHAGPNNAVDAGRTARQARAEAKSSHRVEFYGPPLRVYGTPVVVDAQLDEPVRHAVALALYRAYVPGGLTPVGTETMGDADAVARATCVRVSVVDADGQTATLDSDNAFGAEPDRRVRSHGCRAITALLETVHADGAAARVEVPMNLFCSGAMHQENVWTTGGDWTPDSAHELRQTLFDAFYESSDESGAAETYNEHLLELAAGLLGVENAGFITDLYRACNRFASADPPPNRAVVETSNGHQSLLWVEKALDATDSVPVWLVVAVAGVNMELGAEPARRLAQEIHSDPERMRQLRNCLEAAQIASRCAL